jgi:hypothetical protein
MKTTKNERAYLAALTASRDARAEGEAMDEGFDAGEFSGPAHARAQEAEEVALRARFGISEDRAYELDQSNGEPDDPALDIERPDGTTPRDDRRAAARLVITPADQNLAAAIVGRLKDCSGAPLHREAITLALGTLIAAGPAEAERVLRDAPAYAAMCADECEKCDDCRAAEATVHVAEMLETAAQLERGGVR